MVLGEIESGEKGGGGDLTRDASETEISVAGIGNQTRRGVERDAPKKIVNDFSFSPRYSGKRLSSISFPPLASGWKNDAGFPEKMHIHTKRA